MEGGKREEGRGGMAFAVKDEKERKGDRSQRQREKKDDPAVK